MVKHAAISCFTKQRIYLTAFIANYLAASSANLLLHEPIPAAFFFVSFSSFKVRVSVTSLRDGQTERQPIKSVTVNCRCNTQASNGISRCAIYTVRPLPSDGTAINSNSSPVQVQFQLSHFCTMRAQRHGLTGRFLFIFSSGPTECPSDVATRFASAAHRLERRSIPNPVKLRPK